MSATDEYQQESETTERPFLIREFVSTDIEVTGRTVDVRLVPFGEVARVADPPDYRPYSEEWLPGVFDHQLNAASRIHAKYGHSESVVDVVGHGISLRSLPNDGYHLSTKIHQTVQGETVLELLRDGALPCVSVEARPKRGGSITTRSGVVQRAKADLQAFAFCVQGAFAGARVLALRAEVDIPYEKELLPVELDEGMIERCRRIGIALPARYEAHPAETGTPDSTGTPEVGTRSTQ